MLFRSATGAGGTTPYTYNWSGGLGAGANHPNLCPGTYTVTVVDANGCSVSNSATVSAGSSASAGFLYNGNQCLTGNNYIFTNTGTSGVTYSWDFGDGLGTSTLENPSYTYSSAGTYIVTQTVTNGSCSETATLTIVVNPGPSVTASGVNASCNGVCDGSVTATASGGTPGYNYNWDNGLGAGQSHPRSEEHTSELQSHSFISYAVFCLKKKKTQ